MIAVDFYLSVKLSTFLKIQKATSKLKSKLSFFIRNTILGSLQLIIYSSRKWIKLLN